MTYHSSIAGRITNAPLAAYSASKFASESLSESLALAWRAAMTDEDWVEWGALDDDAWYDRVNADFGIDARPA